MDLETAAASGHRVRWDGSSLQLTARRVGLRTAVLLRRDGQPVAEVTGVARLLIPLPVPGGDGAPDGADGAAPRVVALSALPGTISRAFLLVPDPAAPAPTRVLAALAGAGDGSTPVDLLPFDPPPGSLAARLAAMRRAHPRLYAARHVVFATGKVALALLGVTLLVQLVLRHLVGWIAGWLPDVTLPRIPWPDIALPSLPLPDIDWPDISPPGWLLAVLGTAKYWGPLLVAFWLAAREIRRRDAGRRRAEDREAASHGEAAGHGEAVSEDREGDVHAHR